MNVAVRAVRTTRQAALVARRTISSQAQQEAAAEMQKWKKVSYGMLAISGLGLISATISLNTHHEPEEEVQASYMKIRNKMYHWKCTDCTFFDMDCWKECRANL